MLDTDQFKKDIQDHYDIEEELGSGQFAVVRKIVEKETGDEFAGKYVRKKRTKASRNGMSREDIKREIEILRLVDHDKIIKCHDVYETDREMILVMELLRGGELFDYISKKDFLTEEEAIDFTRQILQGLQHLHSKNVVHLDLKPENILLSNTRKKTIKLVDFGLARVVKKNEQVREIMGTPEFVAPEVLNFDTISTATDMWALGVIAYILLSGASPFLGEDNQETFTNIIQVDYQFDEEYFSEISDEAKDFIKKLLLKDPRKRPTAHDCSRHTWVEEVVVDKKKRQRRRTTQICTFNFKRFVARKRWKMSYNKIRAMNMIAKLGLKAPPGFITEIPPMPTTDATAEANKVEPSSAEKERKERKDREHKKSSINRRKHSAPKAKVAKSDSLTLKTMDIDFGDDDTAGSGAELAHSDTEHVAPSPTPSSTEQKDYATMSLREKRRARGQLRHDEIVKSKEEIHAKKAKPDEESNATNESDAVPPVQQEVNVETKDIEPEKPMEVDHEPVAKATSGGILKKRDSPRVSSGDSMRHEPHLGPSHHGILKHSHPKEPDVQPGKHEDKVVEPEEKQPTGPHDKPVKTVGQPMDTEDTPVETVDKPVEIEDKPVETGHKQVETVDQPMESEDQPMESEDQLVETVDQPVETGDKLLETKTISKSKVAEGKPAKRNDKLMAFKAKLEKPKDNVAKPKEQFVLKPKNQLVKPKDKPVETKGQVGKPKDQLVKPKDQQVKPEDQLGKPKDKPVETKGHLGKPKDKPVETKDAPEAKPVKAEEKPIDVANKAESIPPASNAESKIVDKEPSPRAGVPVSDVSSEVTMESNIETTEMVVEGTAGVSTTLSINNKPVEPVSAAGKQVPQGNTAKQQTPEHNKPHLKNGNGRKLSPSPWQNKSNKEKPVSKPGLQGLSKVSLKANRFMTNDKSPSPNSPPGTKAPTPFGKAKVFQKENIVENNAPSAHGATVAKNHAPEEQLKSVACEINLGETCEAKEATKRQNSSETLAKNSSSKDNEKSKNLGFKPNTYTNSNLTNKVGGKVPTPKTADTFHAKVGQPSREKAPVKNVISVKTIPKTSAAANEPSSKVMVNGENSRSNVKQAKAKQVETTTKHVVAETKAETPVQKGSEEDKGELSSASTGSLTEFTIRPRQNSGAKSGGFDIKLTIGAQPAEQPVRRSSLTVSKVTSSSSSSIEDNIPSDGARLSSVSAVDVSAHRGVGHRSSTQDHDVANGKLSSVSAIDVTTHNRDDAHPHNNHAQGVKYVPQRDFSKYLPEGHMKPTQTTGAASINVKTQGGAGRPQPTFTVKRSNPQPAATKGKKPSVNTTVYVPRRTFGFSAKPGAQSELVIKPVSEADDTPKLNNEQSKRWSQSSNASDRSASSASSEDTPIFRVKLENNVKSDLVNSTERLVNEENSVNASISQKIEDCSSPSPGGSPVPERKWKATLVVPKECEKVPTANENDVRAKGANQTKKHKFTNVRSKFEGK